MKLVSNLPPDKESGANPSEPAPDATSNQKWAPTAESFEKLLRLLGPDHEQAGKEYERLRTKLIRFFEWRGCRAADDIADQTFDRVMKKIDEGETITNLNAYVRKVAHYLFLENNTPNVLTELDEEHPVAAPEPSERDADGDDDALFTCFDNCLAELPPESKRLILGYYQEEKRIKIDLRRELAEQLGIPMNALRIRAHRIRKVLEQCIQSCIAQ